MVLCVLLFVGQSFDNMNWVDILALYMDPGNFSHPGGNEYLRIIIALLGVFLFSALLISVLTNIFENVSTSYRKGESCYSFSNHILIIGGARSLSRLLSAIHGNPVFEGKDILVVTSSDVEELRSKMNIELADSRFINRITYYHRERKTIIHLREAYANRASVIYVIGEDNETAHDALNIRCLHLLKQICGNDGPVIPCYLLMEHHSTLNVFNYMKDDQPSRLDVEVINESDYAVEQLMVNSSFLPALSRADEDRQVHLVIIGNSKASRSFASVAAQICHYPNFRNNGIKTKISFVGYSKDDMDHFVAFNSSLFDLCHYQFVNHDTIMKIEPKKEYGDFMDLEWEFVEGQFFSPYVRSMLESWASDKSKVMVLAICSENDKANASLALHLPRAIYDAHVNIAVYQNDYSELIDAAVASGMYGNLFIFGKAYKEGDMLFMKRSLMGKRVNRVYDLEYGNPPAKDADEAWKRLPYAHKYSSIASANSIPMKLRCFHLTPTKDCLACLSEEDLDSLSELEHRRWMSTMLLMGYRPAPIAERMDRSRFKELKREHFIHLDIAPYDDLPGEEEKDLLIINNIHYILTGTTSD